MGRRESLSIKVFFFLDQLTWMDNKDLFNGCMAGCPIGSDNECPLTSYKLVT